MGSFGFSHHHDYGGLFRVFCVIRKTFWILYVMCLSGVAVLKT